MRPPTISGLVHIGLDVLSTAVNKVTKKILAQTGDAVNQDTDANAVEWWQHVGFASRPAKPVPGKTAAQCVVLKTSDRDAAIASQDLRGLELYGNLDHGEFCVYAAGEDGNAQGRVLGKKDGSISIYTTLGNTKGGTGMGIFVNPDGSITAVSPTGASVQLDADGGARMFNASGAVQVKADGTVKISSTAKVNISAPTVTIGGPTALPVALAPSVLASLTALQTEVAVQAAAWAALAAIPGAVTGTLVQPIAAPVTASTAVATAALAAAAVTLPSFRVAAD